jgi:ubiquinone/menaquinone biosynthesis C-methylase UbiE
MPSIEWNRRWAQNLAQFREAHPALLYGAQWGDPEVRGLRYLVQRLLRPKAAPGPLYKVVDRYLRPYVTPESAVLEIGSGGGRWTRYLVAARRVVCVDINQEFFPLLSAKFPGAPLEFYQSSGCELRGIDGDSIDFVFSFGTLVHIEPHDIRQYLDEIRRVLRPGAIAVVQYAEKSKPAARRLPAFSDMTAQKMKAMAPMVIVAHDTRMLNHSNIIVLRKA